MTDEIAICLITNNLYFETRYCIENLISKTQCKMRFYVLDNASSDKNIIEYCKTLCEQTGGYFHQEYSEVSVSKAMNLLLKRVSEKFCVLFPVNCFVHNHWLEDLIHFKKTIHNSGCISIRNGFEKVEFMPVLHHSPVLPEDELLNVYVTENNSVEGLMMFEKSTIDEKVGFFDEQLTEKGCEHLEFCFRFTLNGFQNFYIRKQTLIKLPLPNDVLFPKRNEHAIFELKQAVKFMLDNQIKRK